MTDELRRNGNLIESLSSALRSGGQGLKTAPLLLREVLTAQRWKHFVTRLGDEEAPMSFEEFATRPPLKGLGADIDLVRRIVADDPELLDLLDQTLQRPPGRPAETVSNLHSSERPSGESSEAALRRLRKDRPDLHQRVLTGELSPHAAAIEAGFRSRRFSIPGDPRRAAVILHRHFDDEDITTLIQELQQHGRSDSPGTP